MSIIVSVAESLVGKMQWIRSNGFIVTGANEANDFHLRYQKVNLPEIIQKVVQKKFEMLRTPEEPTHRLKMNCYEFCYFVLMEAGVLSEEMVCTLLKTDEQMVLRLLAPLHKNPIDRIPKPGDLILYTTLLGVNHAGIFIGDRRIVHLLNSQVSIDALSSHGSYYSLSPEQISTQVGDYLTTHPTLSNKSPTLEEVTHQLRRTAYKEHLIK